jgi:hypothetical protein
MQAVEAIGLYDYTDIKAPEPPEPQVVEVCDQCGGDIMSGEAMIITTEGDRLHKSCFGDYAADRLIHKVEVA